MEAALAEKQVASVMQSEHNSEQSFCLFYSQSIKPLFERIKINSLQFLKVAKYHEIINNKNSISLNVSFLFIAFRDTQ